MRFVISDSPRKLFVWITILCRLLFDSEDEQIEVTLLDWSNDNRSEFDVLQKVFPAPIPLSVPGTPVEVPTSSFKATASERVLFCVVAICVDASFLMRCPRRRVSLKLFDFVMEINCPAEWQSQVRDFLLNELGLQEI